ncbi:MAG: ABC transporter permease [Ilumatobacteraceae bacterium]
MTAVDARRRASMGRSAARQIHYQNMLLLRSPTAPFFTLVVPVMLLITLDLVYGSRSMPTRAGTPFQQFYLPGMMAFATVNACYINIINGTTLARESGMLKRIRGTPLPGPVYLMGRVVSASLVGLISTAAVMILSTTVFGAHMVWGTMPGTVVFVAAGMACFSCIGLALTPLVPTAEAALPIAYGSILPLAFVSDVFFPSDASPSWLQRLADAFPLRPLARSLAENMTPGAHGLGFHWGALGVLAAWTAGAALALRFFRWEPARARRRHHPSLSVPTP